MPGGGESPFGHFVPGVVIKRLVMKVEMQAGQGFYELAHGWKGGKQVFHRILDLKHGLDVYPGLFYWRVHTIWP